ncbi:MAG: molybdopterin-binding protein [Hellea sp.]|nr:molybdopterin-binding protein [Hellea sp.]
MSKKVITAGIVVIGDELLSGRTQDSNISYIAKWLEPLGIRVEEARIIKDCESIIVNTVREFSKRFTYIFTTGGIGPTHDDITADAIAKAFNLSIDIREDAVRMLKQRYSDKELNKARLRMARIPKGASLIKNPVSQAPGFQVSNVFTLAGIPSIMRAMLIDVQDRLETGIKLYSIAVMAEGISEGDAALPLSMIEKSYNNVILGSYPNFNSELIGVQFVARGPDSEELKKVKLQLEAMVDNLKQTESIK